MLTLQDRVKAYHDAFPDYPELYTDGNWLLGYWVIGNYYRNKTDYYGAYPHSYLKRIRAIFPDIDPTHILHLFSGSLTNEDVEGGLMVDAKYDPVDGHVHPNIVADAEELSKCDFKGRPIDMIMADPPYSDEDATHYGIPFYNRNKVLRECAKVLPKGGYLVWLDQSFPMFSKRELKLFGTIGIMRSTNHRFRTVLMWERI